MHGRMPPWLAWILLAAVIVWGMVAPARGREHPAPPAEQYYSTATDTVQTSPALSAASNWTKNLGAEDAGLAARVADVEKALKKLNSKAKAAKKKAAGKMSVTPGGRIYIDTAAFSQDAIDKARYDEQNGVEFRTARLFLKGKGFNVIKYKIGLDFAGKNTVKMKDVYIAVTDLPFLQNVKIGHFKEPFSLDMLTSSRFITFMERNLPGNVVSPSRHFGVMAHGIAESENATYAIGYFAEKDDSGGKIQNDDMGGAVTMRGTWLPWYDEATNGRGLIHLGVAYSHREAFNDEYQIKIRPESHLAHEDSLTLTDVRSRDAIVAEFAMVYGPLSLQSECFVNYINRYAHANSKIQGAYAYVSYFLTGENRVYNRHKGAFVRVKPFENFFRVRDENGHVYTGRGAWELKYRYSWLDAYDGGLLDYNYVGDHTFGVNWYLNPYTRLMLEYIRSGINQNAGAGVGDLNIVQMRAQIDF